MDWTARRLRCRELLSGGRCVFPASVFDPMSARIAEDLDFELSMLAGSVASLTVLGAPDLAVLTLSELSEQCYRIGRAGRLPLFVDADHGYGNALNVRRTIEELETAGVAALTIEDTLLPAPFGDPDKVQLISIAEGVGKMRAALDARQDSKLIICGRTSAAAVNGIEDAVTRAKAYQAAGVDGMFFSGLKTRAQLDAIASALKVPLLLGAPGPELMDRDYLSSRGVRIALQGHAPFMAAVRAVHDTLKALKEGVKPGNLTGVAAADFVARTSRDADYETWTRDFLTAK